jgi:diguanylate cyclase (GGDEF)-like protein
MLLGILVGTVSIALFVTNKDTEMREALVSQAESIDLALGWSSMYDNILVNQSGENTITETPELALHRDRIAKICTVYANCRAVYLMRQNAKKEIYFLIDSSAKTSKLYIAPGTVYSEASKITQGVFSRHKIATDGPVKDRWGVWVSAFVPHLLPDKSVVVVGIDIEAKDWNKTLWKSAIIPALATLIFLGLMLFYSKLWRMKAAQNEVLQQSHHHLLKQSQEDSLTGLPNRRLYLDRLTQMIAGAQRGNQKFAVFYLDLDKFKIVNDTLGHDIGDQLLCVVSERFSSALRTEDTVARLSGDEFAMILPHTTTREDAENVAQKILDALAKPIMLNDQALMVTVSIGIVLYSDQWTTAPEMTHAADEAMYVAKRTGGAKYSFLPE